MTHSHPCSKAGIISSNAPFSQIISHEWHAITSSGFVGGLGHLMTGAIPELTGQCISILLEWIFEELHIRACEIPFRLRLRRAKRQQMLRWIDSIKVGTLLTSQLLLSPFAISAALQQLGLVSSTPASNLLPWSPLSPLRWAWSERADPLPLGSRLLSTLLSPASLWCLSNTLYQIIALNYGSTPFCPEYLILGPSDRIRKPNLVDRWTQQETPNLLRPLLTARNSLLRILGWSQRAPPSPPMHLPATMDNVENDFDALETQPKRAHRETDLSKFPSHFLALNIDSLINQIIFLPLESLFLRSLVSSFLAGPLATRGVRHYPPGAGPVGALMGEAVGPADWRRAGAYANKIGLCMAVQFSIDTAIWGGAYAWTRYVGLSRFHWGKV